MRLKQWLTNSSYTVRLKSDHNSQTVIASTFSLSPSLPPSLSPAPPLSPLPPHQFSRPFSQPIFSGRTPNPYPSFKNPRD
ncbi:unnamed protein product [Prunus brigantina]